MITIIDIVNAAPPPENHMSHSEYLHDYSIFFCQHSQNSTFYITIENWIRSKHNHLHYRFHPPFIFSTKKNLNLTHQLLNALTL